MGSGVLVARDEKAGQWRGLAFCMLGGASFGFQAGADAAEVIILAMAERGVTKLLSPQVKLGADISVAAGPVGGGTTAATAGLSADLISCSMAKGLYGGFSVDGSVAGVRESLNQAYYAKPASPMDILIKGAVKNPQATALMAAVAKLGGGRSFWLPRACARRELTGPAETRQDQAGIETTGLRHEVLAARPAAC